MKSSPGAARALMMALTAALLVAAATACGSSSDTQAASVQLVDSSAAGAGQTGDGGTPAAPPPGPAAPANWVQLSATGTDLGTVVTDVNGRTLYRFDEDKSAPPTTNCSGPCATTWPPVTVQPGGRAYVQGIDRKLLGVVQRPDGSRQMTVGGWPVYRFAGDTNPGDTNGQGVKGTWFAVSPTGSKTSGNPAQGAAPVVSVDAAGGGLQGTQVSLSTMKSSSGTVITDGSGHTVYVSGKDGHAPSRTHCTSTQSCSGYSPVPATSGQSVHVPGVKDRDVDSVRRPDGSRQMTLFGYPLYTSSKDRDRGDTAGDDRAGQWFPLGLDDDD